MMKQAYHCGFVNTCQDYGLDKQASEALYKEAGKISAGKQILEGLWNVGKGLFGVGAGTVRGVGKGLTALDRAATSASKLKGPKINSRLAKSFERGTLSKIPLVKSFGKGFAKAQRAYERNKGVSSSLLAGLGLGKGGIIGNTLAGLGTFTAAHPYLGATAYTLPAIWAANHISRTNDDEATVDTMTPAQRRMFNRTFRADGYSGLGFDASDVSLFGAL